MKIFEVSMAPTKLKKTASTIDALVGLEIEGVFKFPDIDPKHIKAINDIESYEEFRTLFEEYHNQKGNNLACLKNFVYEEILYDRFNGDHANVELDDLIEKITLEELKTNGLQWWEKYFQSFDTVQEFYSRTYFSPIFGSPKDKSSVYNSYQYDVNGYHSNDKRWEIFNQISTTKFKQYIREVVADSSIEFDDYSDDWFSAEIVTKPIPYNQVDRFVIEFFEYLKKEFNFSTNESTGFHINVSINGQRDIDFCKLMVFLGENHELMKYSRQANKFTVSQINRVQQNVTDEKELDYFIEEINKSISATDKYSSFNIDHWKRLHYIEFRIAGGNYSNKVALLLASINRYVTVMDIATDSEKYVQEYHKKVTKLKNDQIQNSKLDLKPDTFENAEYNITLKLGSPMKTRTTMERVLQFDKNNKMSLTPNERIWLRKAIKNTPSPFD